MVEMHYILVYQPPLNWKKKKKKKAASRSARDVIMSSAADIRRWLKGEGDSRFILHYGECRLQRSTMLSRSSTTGQ